MPHAEVYVRLGLSAIHGVGVFAIRPIPKGVDIFQHDRSGLRWVDAAVIDAEVVDPELKKFYADFCIRKADKYGCPVNFNSLTPGWYLNEPAQGQEENVLVDGDYRFLSARDIGPGEELTIRYAGFSEGRPKE